MQGGRLNKFRLMLTLAGSILLIAGCDDTATPSAAVSQPTIQPTGSPSGANGSAPAEVEHALKPEMVILFTKGNLACMSKDDLHEMMDHGARGESTKMQAMMMENGGTCFMVPPTKRVKIIAVEYNNPEMPDMGLVEFVGEGITSINGAWALSVGAEPAAPVKKGGGEP
jgi:hypothetical protein